MRARRGGTGSNTSSGTHGGGDLYRPWPHRFPVGHRSTVLLAVFVALLALVYGFYRVAPTASHAAFGGRVAPGRVMPTTTTDPSMAPATTTAPAATPSTSPTVPPSTSVTSTTLAPTTTTLAVPAPALVPVVAPGPLALSASSSPTFDGSVIQVTVTAELTRSGEGYAGQGVSYTGPGCTSVSALTADDGSATGIVTCTAADTIPITVTAAGKSVVTTVEE